MVFSIDWNKILNEIKEDFSGEITSDWFEINDEVLDDLDSKVSALKLRKLVSIMDRKISKGHFVSNLMTLNFTQEEIDNILSHSSKLGGKFPQLLGKCCGKDIVVTPGKTEVSFYILVNSDFEVALTIEGKFSSFKKKFDGYQDIFINVKEFDERFLIKGNPEKRVIEFLSYEKIRDLIRSFEPIKSLAVDKFSLHIIRNIKKSETFSSPDISDFINRLGLLAGTIENPHVVEKHKIIVPDYAEGAEDSKEVISPEERLSKLEKRFDRLEKTVAEILERLR